MVHSALITPAKQRTSITDSLSSLDSNSCATIYSLSHIYSCLDFDYSWHLRQTISKFFSQLLRKEVEEQNTRTAASAFSDRVNQDSYSKSSFKLSSLFHTAGQPSWRH